MNIIQKANIGVFKSFPTWGNCGGLVLSLLLICSCGGQKSGAENAETEEQEQDASDITLTSAQLKAVDIELGKVARRDMNCIIRVNGRTALDPQDRASVTSLVGGIIRQITVIEGNKVAKGQTVAYIENTDIVALQRDYLTNRSAMIAAEQEHSRQIELSNAGAGVQKNLQQATAECHMAKAKLLGVERQLRQLGISPASVNAGNIATRIPVKAPIAGFVDKIKVATGGFVDMQTPIMDIVENSRLHCDLSVFEKDIADLRTGQQVDLILTNRPETRIGGVIYEINASFEGSTKSVIAHVRITGKPEGLKLIPDMYLTGHIHTGKHNSTVLPSDAITDSEGKKYIFVLTRKEAAKEGETYHFSRQEVKTGASDLGYTQITPISQLPDNATVVTRNAFYLSSMLGGGEEE